jgi:creatinine amidohydrolase
MNTKKIFIFGILTFVIFSMLTTEDVLLYPEETQKGYSIFHETMVDMTWQEVEKAAADGAVILMTTAVIEQHGPHMTCGIDTYLGYLMCKLTRQSLESRGIKTLIAPPLYWGINSVSHIFPGTFSLRPETMKALMHDIFASLKNMGFKNIYNINAHGDSLHIRPAIEAVIDARESLDLNAFYLLSEEDAQRMGIQDKVPPFFLIHEFPSEDEPAQEYLDLHAGGYETSFVAAYFPDMVDMEMAKTLPLTKVTPQNLGEWRTDTLKITPQGYLGDPASTDIAWGKEAMEEICRMMADAIEKNLKKK